MNDTTLRPEVAHFLTQVRARLVDLGPEQRDELLEGLEADLSEQVAAGDPLPEPEAYAAELRVAAGLGAPRRRVVGRPTWPGTEPLLERTRAEWAALVSRHGWVAQAWSVVVALRPAWWVVRAWVAVTLLDQLTGPWEPISVVPHLAVPLLGPALLLVAIVVSTLIGLERLWPGSGPDRPVVSRVVLIALNAVAVVLPLTFTTSDYAAAYDHTYGQPVPVHGDVLRHGREVVRNVYAYDASGQPLTGIQLFDQAGRPVSVAPRSSQGSGADRRVPCPWFNGSTPLWNVFPLPERTQSRGTCEDERLPRDTGEAVLPTPPLASVPSVAPSVTP